MGKAQSNIVSKEIHSIHINPSCQNQLAFHLDDGWDGFNDLANLRCLRKPSWIPAYSIYVVGSLSSNGLYLLDFYPDRSSPCHVDFKIIQSQKVRSDLESRIDLLKNQ
uniref:Uncharacterized protein n=1 Tax=Solanum lycopersicum TaxID=4081 RepID=A0A3Q7JML1_SOLLC